MKIVPKGEETNVLLQSINETIHLLIKITQLLTPLRYDNADNKSKRMKTVIYTHINLQNSQATNNPDLF